MSISVNGARRNAVNWLVDGVMNVDVGSNITLLSTPTLESIEQFKIITSSYAAEWPRSGGGIINVVTKSGTSRFSGSGYEFFRSDKLNSNSYFRKQSTDPAVRDNRAGAQVQQLRFHRRRSGASKEKLFFFFSEELRRIKRAPASLTANVPNPEWLTDPTNANYVRARRAQSDRGGVAAGLSAAECAAAHGRRRRPLPGVVTEHQQHAPGSDPHGLRPQQHAAVVGTLHARSQRDASSSAACSSTRRFPASPAPTRTIPGQVARRSACAASSAATSSTS